MSEKHLSETELMLLLQMTLDKKKSKHVEKKGSNLFDHLSECRHCLFDLWDCYLSAEALQEQQVALPSPKLKLKLAEAFKSFTIEDLLGSIFPVSEAAAPALRTAGSYQESALVKANYHVLLTELPGCLCRLSIKSTSTALEFSWRVSQVKAKIKQIRMYEGELELVESQALNALDATLTFMCTETANYDLSFTALTAAGEVTLLRLSL